MTESNELKEKLHKTNQLLDKLDERLVNGELTEAKYKELAEKYRAEADSLKNQIAEKELLHEVGLKAEEKKESAKEEPVKETGYEDNEDTLVYREQPVYDERKSATLAAVLSFFFMGAGHIYCGKWKRGGAIIGFGFLLGIIAYVSGSFNPSDDITAFQILFGLILLLFFPFDIFAFIIVFDESFTWYALLPAVFLIFLGIWNISDAYNLAKKINRREA
ncbi:MAG: hypothetical protein WC568_08955 [Candidatus Methanoperedens sp.]